MGTRYMLQGWRFTSFGKSLFQPTAFKPTDTPAFAFSLIADPTKPRLAAQIEEIKALEKEEFKKAYMASKGAKEASFEGVWNALAWDDKVIRDGDLKAAYDGFEGNVFISARATPPRQAAPLILAKDATKLSEGMPGAPYGGCYVNAQIEIWGQYGTHKGARATILGVQFARDGDAFGGGKPADPEAFSNLADQGEDDDELAGLA